MPKSEERSIEKFSEQSIREIPEPTRSLLWITDENPEKAENSMGFNIELELDTDGNVKVTEKEKGIYAEPSLIWKQLPIKPNSELRTAPLYWPSYIRLEPSERFQYLNWLVDITQETNLSYVFLYFYGLERHLLTEKYDEAVSEILKLLEHHDKASFKSYATRSLIVASIIKERPDIIDRAPYILNEEIDEALALRIHQGTPITSDDVISISSRVGFKNKRYIKLYPNLFKQTLQSLIDEFESEYGRILKIFDLKDFKWEVSGAFANLSIPENYRSVKIPDILGNPKFKMTIFKLLQTAHDRVKELPDKEERNKNISGRSKDIVGDIAPTEGIRKTSKLSVPKAPIEISTIQAELVVGNEITDKKERNRKFIIIVVILILLLFLCL